MSGSSRIGALDETLLEFAQRLMAVLEQGLTTATYKYAVLLGLIDLCLEHTGAAGTPPTSVTTVQLAEKVLDLYWSHARRHPKDDVVLTQNTKGQAEILGLIERFRARPEIADALSPRDARRRNPKAHASLLRAIEFKLAEMPLPRLQRIGSAVDEFLYKIAFQESDRGLRRSDFASPEFDNSIRFVGRAAEYLVVLSPLLRPVIQREWTAMVARLNGFHEAELERFLFGVQRRPTTSLQAGLRELQGNRCFYCDERLKAAEVDHFIPWARFADDGLDNLVLADGRCNGKKKASLAATGHVERWAQRFEPGSATGSALATIADHEGWDRDGLRTLGVARGIYLNLPERHPLWLSGTVFEQLDSVRVRAALAAGG